MHKRICRNLVSHLATSWIKLVNSNQLRNSEIHIRLEYRTGEPSTCLNNMATYRRLLLTSHHVPQPSQHHSRETPSEALSLRWSKAAQAGWNHASLGVSVSRVHESKFVKNGVAWVAAFLGTSKLQFRFIIFRLRHTFQFPVRTAWYLHSATSSSRTNADTSTPPV